jgi:lysozyme
MNQTLKNLKIKVAAAATVGVIGAAAIAVQYFEGYSLDAHKDPVGNWEVCAGVKITAREAREKPHWTEEECRNTDFAKIKVAHDGVMKAVKVDVTPDVETALTVFAYNVGAAAAAKSTAVKLINAGKTADGCEALNKWIYATTSSGKKVILPGLVTRRDFESNLCLDGAM